MLHCATAPAQPISVNHASCCTLTSHSSCTTSLLVWLFLVLVFDVHSKAQLSFSIYLHLFFLPFSPLFLLLPTTTSSIVPAAVANDTAAAAADIPVAPNLVHPTLHCNQGRVVTYIVPVSRPKDGLQLRHCFRCNGAAVQTTFISGS